MAEERKPDLQSNVDAPKSAFDLASEQFQSWTLSDNNRQDLLNITRSNIEAAWWDRDAWIAKTQEQLRELAPAQPEEVSPVEEVEVQEEVPTPPVWEVEEEIKEQPKPIEEVKEEVKAKEVKPITSLWEFKSRWSTLEWLVEFLQESPREQTEDVQIEWNRVTWVRNGEKFEWSIDSAWNPIRKSLWFVDDEKSRVAKELWIPFETVNGKNVYNPSSLDDAIELFDRFWKNIKLKTNAISNIKATAVFQKYNKYKGANVETYLAWLKSNEIAEWWETWNRLTKMNEWQATPQMLAARDQFNLDLKTKNINDSSSELADAFWWEWKKLSSQEKDFRDQVKKLDEDYIDKRKTIFDNIETEYAKYRAGTEETNELREQANATANEIDELIEQKRKILKDVKKRYPNLSLSAQIKIASDETEAVNDAIFALQKQYKIEFADYQYQDAQDKSVFEFNMNVLKEKTWLLDEMYKTQRWDLIRQEDIARQDRILEQQILQAEQERKQAIIDGDAKRAKELEYQKELLKEKQNINNKAFSFLTPWKWVIAVTNPSTWEVEFKSVPDVDDITSATPTTSTDTTTEIWDISADNFSIPTWVKGLASQNNNPWNVKESPINKDLAIWTDAQWHLIFPDMKTWIQALINDVGAKLEWRTATWLTPDSTLSELANVYAEDNINWLNNVSRNSGYSADTQLKDISLDKLVPAIVNAETSGVMSFLWDSEIKDDDWFRQATVQDFITAGWWWEAWLELAIGTIWRLAFGEWRALSDWDLQRAENIVKSNPNLWLEDAANLLSGYLLVWNADRDLWNSLKNISRSIFSDKKPPLSNMAISLNNGNEWQAIAALENYVYSNVPNSEQVRENTVKNIIDRASELEDLILEWEEITWPFEGTLQEYLWRLKEEGAERIMNRIERLTAETRNSLAWVAVTPTELELIQPLFPKLSQKRDAILDKTTQLSREALRELNNFRNNNRLPSISLNQVWSRDLSDRTDLYTWARQAPTTIPAFWEEQVTPVSETRNRWKNRKTQQWKNPFSNTNIF